jgi:mono/diheme cytochrome c family protein
LTEIPPHLLERSKSRRAALGLLKEGETASAAPVRASEAAPAPAKTAASAPAAAAAPAPVKAPEPPPAYVAAALARKKLPFWVAPVLLFLPVWTFLYVGTLERPTAAATGLLAEGESVYAARCASCHGATGGGGVGPALANGAVIQTWPNASDHVWWVANGSAAVAKGDTYGSAGRVSAGGMPAFGATISAKELLAAVYYERVHFGGHTEEQEAALKELAESADLPANIPTPSSPEDIAALFPAAGN